VASNEPALKPGPQQYAGDEHPEWDTGEWNTAAGWTPPVSEQAPPTKGAVDGWETAEWNIAAAWDAAAAPQSHPLPSQSPLPQSSQSRHPLPQQQWIPATPDRAAPPRGAVDGWDTGEWNLAGDWAPEVRYEASASYETKPAPEAADESWTSYDGAARDHLDAEGTQTAGGTVCDPTTGTTGPIRGRHRVAKQRTFGRGSTVFGVAAVAALGVGGVATAEGRNPLPVSLPDLPKVLDMPGIGTLISFVEGKSDSTSTALSTSAGETLRARILDQAQSQKAAADRVLQDRRDAAQSAAAAKAAKEAAAKKVRDEAAAKKTAAEAAAANKAAEVAAQLAASYVKPVVSYILTSGFGETSSLWATVHTGQDFAAPTGTPIRAIHGGTITSAGWAGAYGYRIIETLSDGTELWYCHQSSMVVTSGTVTTGQVIGRVGATGNVTGPHLHLEVRPGGGSPIDPLPWLRAMGVTV
jgi:murein DD-endopeptidase MepM/ murein hydrolase activator NlpD